MSLSNILGRSLNVFRPITSSVGFTAGRTVTSSLKYPITSSVACRNIYKISNDKRITPVEVKIKLTDAVRNFSLSQPRLSGDHAKLWVYERYVSAALLTIIPVGLLMPNILFDILIAVTSVMHMHWGIEAIVIDYIRPIVFGNFIPKLAVLIVYGLSIFTLVGLFNLIFNNVGLCKSIRHLWRINKEQK